MLNLNRFSKASFSAKRHFGQSIAQKKIICYRLSHSVPSNSGKSNIGKYALGSLIFGFTSLVVYARYDTNFRYWLKTNVYGSDEILKLIFFEENSTSSKQNSNKSKSVPLTNIHVAKTTSSNLESKEPNSVIEKTNNSLDKTLVEEKIVLENNTGKQLSNISKIESEAAQLFEHVSNSYSEALVSIKNYYELVNGFVNVVSHKTSALNLENLKKVSKEKDELFQTAILNAQEACKRLDQLLYTLDDSNIEITSEVKETIKNNIIKLKINIKTLGKNFETEKDNLLLYNKYNNQVINIRKKFSDELQAFFPHVRLEDKDMQLTDAEFNSFVEYITQKLLFYQNELFKQETIGEEQVNNIVELLKNGDLHAKDNILEFKVEKQRRKCMDNFIKESFGLKASSETKFKQKLRLQTEVHMDHLKEAANLTEQEVERRVRLEYSEKAEIAKLKYQEQVSIITAVMHAINDTLKEHSERRDKLNESVSLWTACQTLFAAITTDRNASKHELKPLQELVNNIKKAGENNKTIKELLATIPERVLIRGVYTEETLKDRFFSVEDKAFHLALVPDTNVKLFELITSFVFTIFTLKSSMLIPEEELNNAPININELNNIDILQRARYYVERDNYYQALRYMNLLKGGAKIIADDWMSETREYLATQQAAHTLLAYASASLRSHIGDNNKST